MWAVNLVPSVLSQYFLKGGRERVGVGSLVTFLVRDTFLTSVFLQLIV